MKYLIVILQLCVSVLAATDYMPWTRVDLELYPSVDYTYQHYDCIQSTSKSRSRAGNDHLIGLGVYACYLSYSAELEAILAHTRDLPFGLDQFKLTAKYQMLDDIIGDCISATFGGSLIGATRDAVEDYGLFHHGKLEGELFLTIGQEQSYKQFWLTHWWAMGGVGVGEKGSPWLFSQIAWERNYYNRWEWRLFADILWGLGGNSLNLYKSFHGYGSIKHRSIDLGTRITKLTNYCGHYHFEFTQRVWARNYPEYSSIFQLRYIYPFGL